MTPLTRILAPRSVAIVGASPRNEDAILNLVGGEVQVYGVNPGRTDVLGLPCFPSVSALPEVPDAALLLVNHQRVEEALAECLAAGIRAFVVPGVGAEAGVAGAAVVAGLAAQAAEAGATLVGPNCMGVAVPGGTSLWIGRPPASTRPGHVAALCQSGSVADAFLSLGGRIGLRCVVSLGSEAVTGVADFLGHLADDDGTRAVGLFLETVRRPDAFAEALARCADARKPVVCLKVGSSEAAARAALSHTGALVGSSRAFAAFLRRHGALQVSDFHELIETLELLGSRRRPKGGRVGAVSESGGECGLLADAAEAAGLPYPDLSPALTGLLRERFPNFVEPGNPIDCWAVAEADTVYPGTLEILAGSGEFDILQAQVDLSQFRDAGNEEWSELTLRSLAANADAHGLFPLLTTVHSADPPPAFQRLAAELDVPLLRGPRDSMLALSHVVRWVGAEAVRAPAISAGQHSAARAQVARLLAGRDGALSEFDSSAILAAYGVPFAPSRRAASAAEAAAAAAELGFPVVVKVDGVAHKARVGGVELGITTCEGAARAADRMGGAVLVARQLPPGSEAFVGMTRDPQFGPILAVGRGGVAIEQLAHAVSIGGPIGDAQARACVCEAGFEDGSEELARALVAVSDLAHAFPEIVEIDVNPLLVHGDGVTAVDGLVVVESPE